MLSDPRFTPRLNPRAVLTEKLKEDLDYLDDLSLAEASQLISELKKQRVEQGLDTDEYSSWEEDYKP